MGTAIAMREETAPVPGTPTDRNDLISELDHYANELKVESRLRAYGEALRWLGGDTQNAHYYLLSLDPVSSQLTVTGFRSQDLELAQRRYLETERKMKDKPGMDAVLVSVESVTA